MSHGITNCDETNLRSDFHAIDSKETLFSFLEKYENSTCENRTPYVASATMQKAEHTFWVTKKWEYFSTGRDMLESYIIDNPACLEGRYLRVLVQNNIPKFLGYAGDVSSDIIFIKSNLEQSGLSPEFQNTILKNIEK